MEWVRIVDGSNPPRCKRDHGSQITSANNKAGIASKQIIAVANTLARQITENTTPKPDKLDERFIQLEIISCTYVQETFHGPK